MKRYLFSIFTVFLVSSIVAEPHALAQAGRMVTEVSVRGNKVASQEMVLSKVKTKVGRDFSEDILGEDIKRLYATGYFVDVGAELEEYKAGVRVIFVVDEKPRLVNIIIEGASALKEKYIAAHMSSEVGSILDQRVLKKDIDGIKELYGEKGYSLAKIEYEVDVDEETKEASVYILIDEGSRVKIKGIRVFGNQAFLERKVLKLMKTRKDTLFTSGNFEEDTFNEDLERIRSFYRQAGFADVIVESELRYGPQKQRMYITLKIQEGRRYLAGRIKITGNVLFPTEEIEGALKMMEEEVFSQYNLRQDIARIQRYYFEQGYIFAEVEADPVLNKATGRVDVTYRILENELAYVDKIRIRGNTKSKDAVIRRELRITPGEPFDGAKLQRSKERLYNLGYFEEIGYDIAPGSAPNRKDLVVTVKETKTGEFSLGAGYSSVDQFVAFIEIIQKNFDLFNPPSFTGGGQQFKLRAETGTVRENYELRFTEPWLFGRALSFGFDMYRLTRTFDDYDAQRQGGDVRFWKDFTEYTRADLMYKLEDIKVFDIVSGASQDVRDEAGTNTVSMVTLGVTRDTRDNIFSPRKGMVLNGVAEYAGGTLGGNKDFYKLTGQAAAYFTYLRGLVLELKLRAGVAEEFDDTVNVPLYERFYVGGASTIRGYAERLVGPIKAAEPVGGKTMLIGNIEFTFPVAELIRGAVFYDIGNVWSDSHNFDLGDLRAGIGVGVRVKTPIGPLKLDWGYALDREDIDERSWQVHFSIGRGF